MRSGLMVVAVVAALSALGVFVPQNQASSTKASPLPVAVVVKLAQPVIRAGDPIVLQYQFVNSVPDISYAFPLPDQGKAWLTLHLRDKSGKEVGSASLLDFAGERTVRALTLQYRQQLVWTRLYIWRESPGSSVITDEVTLSALNTAALPAGNYTITAELTLPYAVDPLGRRRGTLSSGFPYETKSEPKGRMFLDIDTGKKTFVQDRLDPSQPKVPEATAETHKTFSLSLDVRDDAAGVHREAEALAARITAAYPAPLPPQPLPAQVPVPPGVTVYGVILPPYNLQFMEQIAASRGDIQRLFTLSGPAAERAQLTVAKTIADKMSTQNKGRVGLRMFYQNVALVGTAPVVDFLANQAWDRKRPEALQALAILHKYGNSAIRQKAEACFALHKAEMPSVFQDLD